MARVIVGATCKRTAIKTPMVTMEAAKAKTVRAASSLSLASGPRMVAARVGVAPLGRISLTIIGHLPGFKSGLMQFEFADSPQTHKAGELLESSRWAHVSRDPLSWHSRKVRMCCLSSKRRLLESEFDR